MKKILTFMWSSEFFCNLCQPLEFMYGSFYALCPDFMSDWSYVSYLNRRGAFHDERPYNMD